MQPTNDITGHRPPTGSVHVRKFIVLALLMISGWVQAQVVITPFRDSSRITPFDTARGPLGKRITSDSIRFNIAEHRSSLDDQVSYDAVDSIVMDMVAQKAHLYGKAVIKYQDITLHAEYIMVDFENKDVFATGVINDTTGKYVGRPEFDDDGQVYEADTMKYNFESKKGLSYGVLTTQDDGFVHGTKVLRDSMEHIYVKQARFTTCNLPEPHFYIQADKIKVIPKKQIITGPANLVIAGINTPVALPFGFFPVPEKRKHGIIMPKFRETEERGFSFEDMGYYFPVNDYIDLLLMGDVYFRGSWGVSLKSNYYRKYRYRGDLTLSYNLNEFGEPESESYRVSNDYRFEWHYTRDAKARPGTRFNANLNFVTSNYLKNNTSNFQDIISTTSISSVSYGRSFFNNKLNLGLTSNMNQNLSNGEMDLVLPQLTANVSRQMPFKRFSSNNKTLRSFMRNLGVSYSGNFKNVVKTYDTTVVNGIGEIFSGSPRPNLNYLAGDFRNGVSHRVPVTTSFKALKWFTISPNFSFNEYWYFKTTEKTWDDGADTLIVNDDISGFERAYSYTSSIGVSTILYGEKQFRKGRLMAIRHVMRPNIGAAYNPDFSKGEENGYRSYIDSSMEARTYSIYENAVLGRPTTGPQASLNFGVGNNLEIKVRSKRDTTNGGVKKVKLIESFNVNSGYNFLADSFNLGVFRLNGNTTILNKVRMTYTAQFDPYGYEDLGENSRRLKEYAWDVNKKLGHITSTRLSISTNLNPDALKSKQSDKVNDTELEFINQNLNDYIDFNIPWGLDLNYTLTHSSKPYTTPNTSQIISVDGNITLTENWKIRMQTGYDMTKKELAFTSMEFHRDLHCWQMGFKWYPVQRQFFEFSIRAKSATLQELKLNRTRSWWDL